MAGKKIFIEYDIDSSDLKIANGETLSLTQQLRLLKKELQRGDLKPEQFDILRKKIGDTEDQIARTTVKSKDFFGVLSTLPGPVGQFGGSLLAVVDTLKVFSSFSFKDIKNSLSDIGDDVVEITRNFTGLGKSTQDVGQANKDLVTSNQELASSSNQSAIAAGATAGAISTQKKETQLLRIETDQTGQAMIKAVKPIKDMTKEELELFKQQRNRVVHTKDLTQATNAQAVASETATVATTTQTVATQTLTVAQRAATFATNALKIALASLGIGLIIIAVSELVSLISEFASGTKEAERAQKQFNDELERTNTLLDLDLKAAKRRQDLRVAELKARGASEKEINDQTLEGLKENFALKQQALEDANALYNKTLKRNDENALKDLETIGKKQLDLDQEVKDLRNQIKIAELQDDIKAAEKRKEQDKAAADKLAQQRKEAEQKRINDTKSAEDQLAELIRSNSELRIRDERERQFQELKNQKQVEEEKIKALSISEELRGKLLEQVRLKYGYKLLNMNQKFVEEDLKALKEFQRKREDIEISAIEDTRKREDAEREVKLKRDLEDLEEDKEFAKLSEEAKEEIRKNIRQRYANEAREETKSRNKEDQDDRLKKLDDELRFLQIRQEAIRAGTKAFFDSQREILAVAEKREIELAEGKEQEITAIKAKYAKLRKDIDQQEKMATLSAIGETIGAIGNLTAAIAASYDEEAKTSKEAFEKRKKLQIATAVMSAASGIIQILTQPSTLPSPFDWIVKGINAAALAVTTAVQIKNIKNTKFEDQGGGTRQAGTVRGMANGGIVRGPGGPKSDSVPTNLSNGEAVMTSGAVTMFAPLLSMMNQMGGGASFSSDISVASADNPIRNNPSQEQTPVIMKTYVVESELTTSQQKQARLKELSTL